MRTYFRLRLDRYAPTGEVAGRYLAEIYREFREAATECERVQAQLDAQCEPVVVFVVDHRGIPRWRVGALDREAEPEAEDSEQPECQRIA